MCDTFNIAEGFHHPISKVKCKVEHGEEEITGDKRRLEEMRGNERKWEKIRIDKKRLEETRGNERRLEEIRGDKKRLG